MRMFHSWHRCEARPLSVRAAAVEREFAERVLGCVRLDGGWREAVLRAPALEGPQPDRTIEVRRIEAAMANLRKQHLWGALGDSGSRRSSSRWSGCGGPSESPRRLRGRRTRTRPLSC